MKKALVIGAGPIYNFDFFKSFLNLNNVSYDLVIAVDGGYNYLQTLNIKADLLITDLDSINKTDDINLKYLNTKDVYRYNSDKNDTDMFIASKSIVDRDIKTVDIIGGTNGRFDHTMANLRVLNFLKEKGVNSRLIDECNIISILNNEEVFLKHISDVYISFFTFSLSCILTIKGLKYELDSYILNPNDQIAVSNEFKNKKDGYIKVEGKAVMVISSKIEHL